jgi:hypothetical protein
MLTGAVRRNIVEAAEAMPADKFGFAPTVGEFSNVRIGEALIHSYDPYGQMVVYLRMNGVVPPAARR